MGVVDDFGFAIRRNWRCYVHPFRRGKVLFKASSVILKNSMFSLISWITTFYVDFAPGIETLKLNFHAR